MTARKVVVTVAPTGGFLTKRESPYVPLTPDEIAADVERCVQAGASVAALHARREDGEATCRADYYRAINERVRARSDVVINNSTGGGLNGDLVARQPDGSLVSLARERGYAAEAGAEMCSLNAMTVLGTVGDREVVVSTSPREVVALHRRMLERDVKAEWEAFSPTHLIQDISRASADGADESLWVSLCFGLDKIFQGAVPFSPDNFHFMHAKIPEGARFSVNCHGADQMRALAMSLTYGGHIRVGLEDRYVDDAGECRPNVWFVERAVELVRLMGCEPATPAEARHALGLKPQGRPARSGAQKL